MTGTHGLVGLPLASLYPRSDLCPHQARGARLTCGSMEALWGAGYMVPLSPHTEVVQGPRFQGLHLVPRLICPAGPVGLMPLGDSLPLGVSPTSPLDPVGVEQIVGVLGGLPVQHDRAGAPSSVLQVCDLVGS